MLIIDGHQDIAYNALEWGRDIRQSVYKTREREALPASKKGVGNAGFVAMSGLPELRQGGIGLVFGVIFAYPAQNSNDSMKGSLHVYNNAQEAYEIGQAQLAYYKSLAREPGISLIGNQSELAQTLADWRDAPENDRTRPIGLVPLLEGADPIRTPEEATQWFSDGIRIVGLAWRETRYSGGTRMPGPLTVMGRTLLKEMEKVGLVLDISHMAEESFWEALHYFQGPLIASHSNCRVFTPTDRHLSDAMIQAIVERDGVIGIVPVNPFLTHTWSHANSFEVGFDQVVRHIDHICQLSGNAYHVGIGSDIDGGFGLNETPVEMETVADLVKLAGALRKVGYKEDDIVNVMGGNWQRFLEHALPI